MTEVEKLRGNLKALEAEQRTQHQKDIQTDAANLQHSDQLKKTLEYLTKALEKSVNDADRDKTLWGTEIRSTEQTIKRLERQVELLSKEVGTLKKEALTSADLKPLSDQIKKLQK